MDHNRNMHTSWVEDARSALRFQQERLIGDLEEKLHQAPAEASDEFMYQDKQEVVRELESARKLLDNIPGLICSTQIQTRTWNVLPYQRYRGADKE